MVGLGIMIGDKVHAYILTNTTNKHVTIQMNVVIMAKIFVIRQ
jgi:hypothetical protein